MISRSTLSGATRVAIASATARIAMDKTTAKIEMIPKTRGLVPDLLVGLAIHTCNNM